MFGCSSSSVAEPNHTSLMSRPAAKNIPAAISHNQCVVYLHMTSYAMRLGRASTRHAEAFESDVPIHGHHLPKLVYRRPDHTRASLVTHEWEAS